MDVELFDKALKQIGYSYGDMQNLLGISRTAFYRKRNGETQFTLEEIRKIMTVIPENDCVCIFFRKKVS